MVEDQALFREFLVDALEGKLDCQVVGQAADGETALDVVRAQKPDLLILDILIPRLSGIHVASILGKEIPTLRIMGLSAELDVKTVHQVHRLQLAGFIDKNDAGREVLQEAVACMRKRQRYFSPTMSKVLRSLKIDPQAFSKILTRREQEVLTLAGWSDDHIAEALGLGVTSVQTHRKNLFRKLDVHSTPELIRYAHQAGFWKSEFERMDLRDTYHLHD